MNSCASCCSAPLYWGSSLPIVRLNLCGNTDGNTDEKRPLQVCERGVVLLHISFISLVYAAGENVAILIDLCPYRID